MSSYGRIYKAPRKRQDPAPATPSQDDDKLPQHEEIEWTDEDEAAADAAWAKLGPIFRAEREARERAAEQEKGSGNGGAA